jgi:hypothetical protein
MNKNVVVILDISLFYQERKIKYKPQNKFDEKLEIVNS